MKLSLLLKDIKEPYVFEEIIQMRLDDEETLTPFIHVVHRKDNGMISQASFKIDEVVFYDVELDEEATKQTEAEIERQEMMKKSQNMEDNGVVPFKH